MTSGRTSVAFQILHQTGPAPSPRITRCGSWPQASAQLAHLRRKLVAAWLRFAVLLWWRSIIHLLARFVRFLSWIARSLILAASLARARPRRRATVRPPTRVCGGVGVVARIARARVAARIARARVAARLARGHVRGRATVSSPRSGTMRSGFRVIKRHLTSSQSADS